MLLSLQPCCHGSMHRHSNGWHGRSGCTKTSAVLAAVGRRRTTCCAAGTAQEARAATGGFVQVSTSGSVQQLHFDITEAHDAAALRAAAYLRAQVFYTYPPGRSEYAARMHRRMKGDAEWTSVTAKVEGTEPDYKDVYVWALVATIEDDPSNPVAVQVCQDMDLSTKLPGQGGGAARLVVGSPDINQGAVLPAEELVGRQPQDGTARTRRAYLSNVCVAVPARRYQVAQALIRTAEEMAASRGVEHLYVHVVFDNIPARRLYDHMGFFLETQETVGFASTLNRPRRLLLHKALAPIAVTC